MFQTTVNPSITQQLSHDGGAVVVYCPVQCGVVAPVVALNIQITPRCVDPRYIYHLIQIGVVSGPSVLSSSLRFFFGGLRLPVTHLGVSTKDYTIPYSSGWPVSPNDPKDQETTGHSTNNLSTRPRPNNNNTTTHTHTRHTTSERTT